MIALNAQAPRACQTVPKLIFPCSGASEVGGLSDRAALQMTLDRAARRYCLAGIGGRVAGIMANTRGAAKVLVIDGDMEECARMTMEMAGCSGSAQVQLECDLAFEKGARRVTAACIRQVADRGVALLAI